METHYFKFTLLLLLAIKCELCDPVTRDSSTNHPSILSKQNISSSKYFQNYQSVIVTISCLCLHVKMYVLVKEFNHRFQWFMLFILQVKLLLSSPITICMPVNLMGRSPQHFRLGIFSLHSYPLWHQYPLSHLHRVDRQLPIYHRHWTITSNYQHKMDTSHSRRQVVSLLFSIPESQVHQLQN